MKRAIALITLLGSLVGAQQAMADVPPLDWSRRQVAAYERRNAGWNKQAADIRVSAECPVVAPNTRRCYFRVTPGSIAGRFGPQPYAGYVRIRVDRVWETKVYTLTA